MSVVSEEPVLVKQKSFDRFLEVFVLAAVIGLALLLDGASRGLESRSRCPQGLL